MSRPESAKHKIGGRSLVQTAGEVDKTQDLCIGFTMSFTPKQQLPKRFIAKVTGKKYDNMKTVTWGRFTPREQCEMMTYIHEELVFPLIDCAELRFELTKSGEIHGHSLLIIKNGLKMRLWNLSDFRKTLNYNFRTWKKINSIHALHNFIIEDPDDTNPDHTLENWIKYLKKAEDQVPIKPRYKNMNCYSKIFS